MSANPRQFPVIYKNVRRALLRRFPYAPAFVIEVDETFYCNRLFSHGSRKIRLTGKCACKTREEFSRNFHKLHQPVAPPMQHEHLPSRIAKDQQVTVPKFRFLHSFFNRHRLQ